MYQKLLWVLFKNIFQIWSRNISIPSTLPSGQSQHPFSPGFPVPFLAPLPYNVYLSAHFLSSALITQLQTTSLLSASGTYIPLEEEYLLKIYKPLVHHRTRQTFIDLHNHMRNGQAHFASGAISGFQNTLRAISLNMESNKHEISTMVFYKF